MTAQLPRHLPVLMPSRLLCAFTYVITEKQRGACSFTHFFSSTWQSASLFTYASIAGVPILRLVLPLLLLFFPVGALVFRLARHVCFHIVSSSHLDIITQWSSRLFATFSCVCTVARQRFAFSGTSGFCSRIKFKQHNAIEILVGLYRRAELSAPRAQYRFGHGPG